MPNKDSKLATEARARVDAYDKDCPGYEFGPEPEYEFRPPSPSSRSPAAPRAEAVDGTVRAARRIGEVWAGARHCFAIKMSRDADLRIDDEYEGELIGKIRTALELRPLL